MFQFRDLTKKKDSRSAHFNRKKNYKMFLFGLAAVFTSVAAGGKAELSFPNKVDQGDQITIKCDWSGFGPEAKGLFFANSLSVVVTRLYAWLAASFYRFIKG